MKHISPFRYTEATQDEVVANLIAGAAIAGRNRTLSLATLVKRGLDRVPRSVDGAQPCTLAPAPRPMCRAARTEAQAMLGERLVPVSARSTERVLWKATAAWTTE